MKTIMNIIACSALALAVSSVVVADEAHKHGHDHNAMMKDGHKDADHAHDETAEMAVFTGEVIDLTCFTAHPETGQGAEHASCAKTCLEKGLPAGLLVGDRLYVALMHDHSAPFKSLAPYAGQTITVKGIASESHGSLFLTIDSIESPAKKAAAK